MKRVVSLLAACAVLLPVFPAGAAEVCAPPVHFEPLASNSGIGGTGHAGSPDSGIGGTGRTDDASGIGGTGHTSGIGGTGHAGTQESGIGGTGRTDDASGIGGTGHALTADGGIGGTGRGAEPGNEGGIGGTGIVGTITGFASICVDGLEVHYDDAVPVSENGQPANARGLAIGQLVAVEAGMSARGLEARRIAVLHALEGPVTRALGANGRLEVMGAAVSLGRGVAAEQVQQLKVGDWVQVSGHPVRDAGVLATRVARIEARPEASATGLAEGERMQVGGVAVDRAAGGEVTVRGAWDGQRIRIRESSPAAGTVWVGRPDRVVIETRVRQRDGDTIRTDRRDVDAALAARSDRSGDDRLSEGTLIRITARIGDDGKLRPIRIERADRERGDTRGESSQGKSGSRGRSEAEQDGSGNDRSSKDAKDAAKEAKDAAKANEKLEKKTDRADRSELDSSDRGDRGGSGRTDRVDRNDRTDRTDRGGSGRDR